jgi:predicted transcriptional regulator
MVAMSRDHERRLVRYIARWGPVAARAVGDGLMRDPGEVARALARLARAGRIAIVGRDARGEPCYGA